MSGRGQFSLIPLGEGRSEGELRVDPTGKSTQKEVRYLDIHEDDRLDEALMASWIRQASKLPGETCN